MKEKTTGKRLRVRAILVVGLAAAVMSPAALQAQETWPMGTGIGLFGGYAMPSSDLYSGSIAYGLNLSYVVMKNLAIELTGFRFESDVEGSTDGLSAGKLAVMPIQLSLQGRFPVSGGRLVPFVEAGAGYYLNTFTLDEALASDWSAVGFNLDESVENVVGFHFGAGLDFFVARNIALGAGVKYCIATTKGAWSLTETATGTSATGDLEDLKVGPLAFGIRLRFIFK